MPEKQPIPLSKLNVLAHPLFLADHRAIRDDEEYMAATKNAYHNAQRRFVPKNISEMLLVMPFRNEPAEERPAPYRLFERLKSSCPVENAVQITPDMLFPSGRTYLDVLNDHGKIITADTEIIVGGEWLDQCVESVAKKFIRHPEVNKVKIDRLVSIKSPSILADYLPAGAGLDVRADHQYIYLAKLPAPSLHTS